MRKCPMPSDGACCRHNSSDLRKHQECHEQVQRCRSKLQPSVDGALSGQHTDTEALAAQSSSRPAATDHTAKQMQHSAQQDTTAKASPRDYSVAMPTACRRMLTTTDLANNGKQGHNLSYDLALDASSDSLDFPDDGTSRSNFAATRLPCLGGTRASFKPKATDQSMTIKTSQNRRRKSKKNGNDRDSEPCHANTADKALGNRSVASWRPRCAYRKSC